MNTLHWEFGRMYDMGPTTRDSHCEPMRGPVVVCPSISCDDFLTWLESSDDAPQRWQFEASAYGMGRIVVYSTSTLVHQRTASAIIESIRDQVMQLGEDPALENALLSPASLVCRVGDRLQAPDDALVPAEAAKHSFPTLVVEIAYTNETLAMLQTRLSDWVHRGPSASVQIAIGVKIDATTLRLTIVLMQPGMATQFVEVGGRGRGAWQGATAVTFPLGALFRGYALPLALRGQEREFILIDSDDLRCVVQRAQRTMRRRGGQLVMPP